MIINKTSVSFAGRVPSPRYIPVGVVGDNRVECVEFKLPTIADSQTATMLINCKFADAITLERTENNLYCADITSQIAGESGNIEAYIRIDGTDGTVWNSEKIILCVCNVPDISGKVEEQEPTALDKNLSAIAVHKEEMSQHSEAMRDLTETATKSAENAADAAKRAEEAAKSTENKPGIPGKSAYQYAQDGGYEGTEAEFAAKLAQEIPAPYTLPAATAETLGGVKVGNGLGIDTDGVLFNKQSEVTYEKTVTISEPVTRIEIDLPGLEQIEINFDAQAAVAFPRIQFHANKRCFALSRKITGASSGNPTALMVKLYKHLDKIYSNGYTISKHQYSYTFTGTHDIQVSGIYALGVAPEPIYTVSLESKDAGVDIPTGVITIAGL